LFSSSVQHIYHLIFRGSDDSLHGEEDFSLAQQKYTSGPEAVKENCAPRTSL
jgi:hypothetical protein